VLNIQRCKFVKEDVTGGDGTSWENAYNSIKTALFDVVNNDLILVAPGALILKMGLAMVANLWPYGV